MLNEEEFARLRRLYDEGIEATKVLEMKYSAPEVFALIDQAFLPVTKEYEAITGFAGMHPGAAMHHRIVLDDFERKLNDESKRA